MNSPTTPPSRQAHQAKSRQARGTRRAAQTREAQQPEPVEEAFWARLEEREEGRVAQEADHLFDTSYSWAA